MTLSSAMVAVLLGLVLPVVVGFMTKANASDKVKIGVGIIVAGVASTVQNAVVADGSAFISAEMALNFVLVYGSQLLSYLGIWKPVRLNEKVAPDKGIG